MGYLTKVVALSRADAWAVGFVPLPEDALTMHWNGMIWSRVSTPSLDDDYLLDVDGVATNDVWAVGYCLGARAIHGLALHGDGFSWVQVPVPDADSENNQLNGVAAISSTDVWAVGVHRVGPIDFKPLIEHWDGSAWTVVPSPVPPGADVQLLAASATSADDVWAVGLTDPPGLEVQALIEHWDGSSWRVVKSPLEPRYSELFDVSALSAKDAWAVGFYQDAGFQRTLTEHWDGHSWKSIPSPSPESTSVLWGVDAVSSTNIWAVGRAIDLPREPLTEHSFGFGC